MRFNRTFMELKHSICCQGRENASRFNRTFMELKPQYFCYNL